MLEEVPRWKQLLAFPAVVLLLWKCYVHNGIMNVPCAELICLAWTLLHLGCCGCAWQDVLLNELILNVQWREREIYETSQISWCTTSCITEGWQWHSEASEIISLCSKQAQRHLCSVPYCSYKHSVSLIILLSRASVSWALHARLQSRR